MNDLGSLLAIEAANRPSSARLTYGIVNDPDPLTVFVSGAATATPTAYLSSYHPTSGDFVAILAQLEDRLVLGSIGSPRSTFTAALKQGGTPIAATTTDASFVRLPGFTIAAHLVLVPSANGSGTTEIKVTPTGLPTPATGAGSTVGIFRYHDVGTDHVEGSVEWDGTDLKFVPDRSGSTLGADPARTVASGDTLAVSLLYQRTPG